MTATLERDILTPEQIEQFHRDGFLLVRQLIDTATALELASDYDRASRGEIDVPGWKERIGEGKLLQLGNPSRHIPGWAEHLYLKRIVAVGRQLLGDDMDYAYDQLIMKPGGNPHPVPWHQDAGYGWPGEASHRSATCWLALSRVTVAHGSLHFMPGSHTQGIAQHYSVKDKNPINGALEVQVDQSKAIAVEYEPGDATFHHGRTLHYSPPNIAKEARRGLSTHLWPKAMVEQHIKH